MIYKICGYDVDFPFAPYPSQLVVISNILTALENSSNGIIESPTGTGKSLSFLSAVCAFIQHPKNRNKKIQRVYIATRTHKQMDQLVKQLKLTKYAPPMTILASREVMCVNQSISHVPDKNAACKDLVKKNACNFFSNKEKLLGKFYSNEEMGKNKNVLFDIEDLKKTGKRHTACPYYASRILGDRAEIILCPYNYLLDPVIREISGISLENSIVIIDEAHNIEDTCRSTGTLEITTKVLNIVQNELLFIFRTKLKEEEKPEALILMNIFQRIKKFYESEKKENIEDFVKSVSSQDAKISPLSILKENFLVDEDILRRAFKSLRMIKEELNFGTMQFIEKMVLVFQFILKDPMAYGYEALKDGSKFILLDPSLIFKMVSEPCKSVVLVSGTISPFKLINSELGCQFRTVSVPHVISKERVFVRSISHGDDSFELKGTYENINKESVHGPISTKAVAKPKNYFEEVSKIIRMISVENLGVGGTIVFVPSFNFLEKIKKNLQGKVNLFVEGKNEISEYIHAIKKGAVLLAVFRGRMSEGMDFKDEYARAVISVGIPFPSLVEKTIKFKREYNDLKNKTGGLWYELQAYRAINQGVGRCIRHSEDYGAIFLIDSRYRGNRAIENLSAWLRVNIKHLTTFNECKAEYKDFIQTNEKLHQEKKAKRKNPMKNNDLVKKARLQNQ